jgi:hypothetical protein
MRREWDEAKTHAKANASRSAYGYLLSYLLPIAIFDFVFYVNATKQNSNAKNSQGYIPYAEPVFAPVLRQTKTMQMLQIHRKNVYSISKPSSTPTSLRIL